MEYYGTFFKNSSFNEEQKADLAEKLSHKFHLTSAVALGLLNAKKPICLKKKISIETALKFKNAFNTYGLDCEIHDHKDMQSDKPLVERRSKERRTGEDRREHCRASALRNPIGAQKTAEMQLRHKKSPA